MANNSDPVFTISLEKGLADRRRMPIGQVLSVLNEVRHMLIEAGREIQKERGIECPALDFGLELIADGEGRAFSAGSFRASMAITSDVEVGIEAARRVLDTVYDLGKKPMGRAHDGARFTPTGARIVNRLDRMTFLQQRSKAQAKFQVHVPRTLKPDEKMRTKAVFGEPAVKRLVALREPVFSEEGVVLYGKLVELKDRTQLDSSAGKFWGELRRDNGERWRVEFSEEYQAAVVPLFRQQVRIFGTAQYFQTRAPKLVPTEKPQPEDPKDYVAAFDELFGSNRNLYNADFETLLRKRYGED